MPFGNLTCMEDGTFCDFVQHPFDAMMQPFVVLFGDFTYPIIYGIFIGIIWLYTKDIMLTGMLGILVASAGITAGILGAWEDNAIMAGILLVAVALAVVIYQVFIHKSASPAQ